MSEILQTIPLQMLSAEPVVYVERVLRQVENHVAGRIGKRLRENCPGYVQTISVHSSRINDQEFINEYTYLAKLKPIPDDSQNW